MKIAARLLSALLVTVPVASFAKDLPNLDAFASVSPAKVLSPTQQNALIKPGTEVQYEQRLGVPSFLWAAKEASSQQQSLARWSLSPEQVARNYLADYASFYRLSAAEAAQTAVLQSVHNTGKGAIIAKFRQVVDGVDVFRNEINVVMNQDRELVALSGYLTPNGAASELSARFGLTAHDAVAKAFEDLAGSSLSPSSFYEGGRAKAGYTYFSLSRSLPADSNATLNQAARAKQAKPHARRRLVIA